MHTLNCREHYQAAPGPQLAVANTLSETVLRIEPVESAPARRSSWTRWPKWILLFLAFLWLAGAAISLLIQHSRLHRKITARLESVLGRPVEVGRYNFSLWGWPTLAAKSITVGEDSRFGQEYFLRAESLTMRLRWRGLLRGRLEFGTLSLEHPSLNLVRNTDGDWNLAEWLPRPSAPSPGITPVGPQRPPSSPLRFTRVEVDSGRINFKRNDEKIPFAFSAVNGFLEPDGPGRWRFDLEAIPSRAAVVLQQAGTLHLSGHVGGTSSRLRPAALDLSWTDASISDVLRLARNYDFGVRGAFALSLHAQTDADAWLVEGRTELRQVHRWDLPLRADNPAVNLLARLRWHPLVAALEFEEATLEAPHSHASVRAAISWEPRRSPRAQQASPFSVQVNSSLIDAGDLLAWLRAFHAGVADDLSLRGAAKLEGVLRGWPWRIEKATLDLDDAQLSSPRWRVPVLLRATHIHYDQHGISHTPIALSFGEEGGPSGGFIIADGGTSEQTMKGASNLRLVGRINQVRDVVATAGALGWNISRGWDLAGPVAFEYLWLGGRYPWLGEPYGTIEWGGESPGGSLAAPFLNFPVEHIRASYDVRRGGQGVEIRSADAFGARWKGHVSRPAAAGGWQFSLSADHLAATDLDRWLNPRWRQSLLGRVLPFLGSRSEANAVPENLRASGKITVDQFAVAPLAVHRLQGDVKLEGRHIKLVNAKAQLYGGELGGSFDAELAAVPAYNLRLNFSRVDLAALTAATPGLANLFAGSATGNITINTRGANRADLFASLECRGAADVGNPVLRELDLGVSLADGVATPGLSRFTSAGGSFTCSQRALRLQNLSLGEIDSGFNLLGTVDFNGNLDLQLTPFHALSAVKAPTFRVTGLLTSPQIARATAPAARP